MKAQGYERLPIDIHHKTKKTGEQRSKRAYCTNHFPSGAPGTFLWVRHGYGDAITDIHIPQCGFAYKSFEHEYGTCDTSVDALKAASNQGGSSAISIGKSEIKTSDFFKENAEVPLGSAESKNVGACAICDAEFAVETKHRSLAQGMYNIVSSPKYVVQFGALVGKAILFAVEAGYYRVRYNRRAYKWDDFGQNPMFHAPILSIFSDPRSTQGGIATGKCTAYYGCKERDYQFVSSSCVVFERMSSSA